MMKPEIAVRILAVFVREVGEAMGLRMQNALEDALVCLNLEFKDEAAEIAAVAALGAGILEADRVARLNQAPSANQIAVSALKLAISGGKSS